MDFTELVCDGVAVASAGHYMISTGIGNHQFLRLEIGHQNAEGGGSSGILCTVVTT